MAALTPGDAPRLISPRTVQLHLHKGFTQLDITSRNELGRAPPSYLDTRQIRDRGVWSASVEPVQKP